MYIYFLFQNYKGSSNMDAGIEKILGTHLCLCGPMIDGYLQQIGKAFLGKLGRGSNTGVAPAVSMYIPWQIYRFMVTLCGTYGALIHNTKPKKGRVYIFLESDETARKIFDPWRFDGTNYLSKRQYKKVPGLDKKLRTVYGGRAIVPVTMETPIRMEYVLSTNIVKITFYIQRYTADDLAIDAHVQSLIDRDCQLQEMDAE